MDLKTLQYPRHIHKDGAYQIVPSWEACDTAMDDGWVLSPGDAPRETADAGEASDSPGNTPDMEPVAPRRKPGRPRTLKE